MCDIFFKSVNRVTIRPNTTLTVHSNDQQLLLKTKFLTSSLNLNVVEMLKPRSRPTVDGLQIVVVFNVVDGCRSPLCRHLKRLNRSVVMLILIYVCRMYRTLLPYSVQRSVVHELPVIALFDVQR